MRVSPSSTCENGLAVTRMPAKRALPPGSWAGCPSVRATKNSAFHGPIHDSQGDSDGSTAARWKPMPSSAGALLLNGSALCQPGPHHERCAHAWACRPNASTATALSSRCAVALCPPSSATASSRPPTCIARCGPSSSPERSCRLLPGVASSPKPLIASWRSRTVTPIRPDCCAASSSRTRARASSSAGGSVTGSASSARCTASRGNGHCVTVNSRPPSSTSNSISLRAAMLGIHGTDAARHDCDNHQPSNPNATAHARARLSCRRPAPAFMKPIISALMFFIDALANDRRTA